MVDIVINERGGPPLHYVLAHLTLSIEPSPTSLRALSVAAMLLAVPVVYDLGRQLGGVMAGSVSVVVAVLSPFMDIFGSFGRPYAVFLLTSVLALNLFVRAMEKRTLTASALAALAAVLAAATHTYGFYLILVEGVIALALWRFRPFRGFLIVLGTGVLLIPLVIGAHRLSERFAVVQNEDLSAQPRVAARQVFHALIGSSAGRPTFWLFAVLALVGMVVLVRRRPSVGALALGLLLAPPLAYLFVSTRGGDGLSGVSPRHLLFLLPLWTSLIGVGAAQLGQRLPVLGRAVAVALLAIVAAVTPIDGVFDVRERAPDAENGDRSALRAPARLLRREIAPNDVLYPHSVALLAALPATRNGFVVIPGVGGLVKLGFERIRFPVNGVVVPVPIGLARVDKARLQQAVGPHNVSVFRRWIVVRISGPFADEDSTLHAIATAQAGVEAAVSGTSPGFTAYIKSRQGPVCRRLRELLAQRETCP